MTRTYRVPLPRWDLPDWRGRREVWSLFHGNGRAPRSARARARITRETITTIATRARAERIPRAPHLIVELVWCPADNRARDADNLWPLLKVACDALARGPRKRANGGPGLDLVDDDIPALMTKLAPRITPPSDQLPAGLWLLVTTADGPPE